MPKRLTKNAKRIIRDDRLDTVLPNLKNFPDEMLLSQYDLFGIASSGGSGGNGGSPSSPSPSPSPSAGADGKSGSEGGFLGSIGIPAIAGAAGAGFLAFLGAVACFMMSNKSTKTVGEEQQQQHHHRQASSKGDIELAANSVYAHSSNPVSKGSRMEIAIAQPAAGGAALPPGWTQLWDESSARPYYYNAALEITQWERP